MVADTRTRILQAALKHFSRAGFSGTSMKQLAQAANIKAPSIYAHFASKDELYDALYSYCLSLHAQFFRERLHQCQTVPPLEALRLLLQAVHDFYSEHPQVLAFHLRTAVSYHDRRPKIAELFAAEDDELSTGIRQIYASGLEAADFSGPDADSFTSLFLSVLDGLFLEMGHYSPEHYNAHFQRCWTALHTLLTLPAPIPKETI